MTDTIPQDDIPRKKCSKCKEVKVLDDFPLLSPHLQAKLPSNSKQMGRRPACKECKSKDDRAYHKRVYPLRDPCKRKKYKADPQRERGNSIKKNYGITLEDYQIMLDSQDGLCASCGNPEIAVVKRTGKVKPLAVDHCHTTRIVRGLLCSNFNQALGCLKDDPVRIRALLAYAEKWCIQK